jgi:hypothetical protein
MGGHIDGAMTYTAFAVNNKGKVRALAVAMDKRHPLLPDVPTFKELGVDWVDGAYRASRCRSRRLTAQAHGRIVGSAEQRPRDERTRGQSGFDWSTSEPRAWTSS